MTRDQLIKALWDAYHNRVTFQNTTTGETSVLVDMKLLGYAIVTLEQALELLAPTELPLKAEPPDGNLEQAAHGGEHSD